MAKGRRYQQRLIPIKNEPQHMIRQLQELEIPCCATCYSEDGDEGTILLPLPKCTCTLKLVQGPLPHPIEMILHDMKKQKKEEQQQQNLSESSNSEHRSQLMEKIERSTELSQITSYLHLSELHLERHNHVPMCKCCIEKMIEVSSEVIELEYRDSNQPNPKFTVEAKCPHCSSKFSHRGLQRLLQNARSKEWENSLLFTNKTVNVMKMVTERIKIMNTPNIKNMTEKTYSVTIRDHSKTTATENNICSGENHNHCKKTSTIEHDETKACEVSQELLRRDPLYKQEVEDMTYIQKLMKSHEGRQELGLIDKRDEAKRLKRMEEKDRKYAKKLHFQLNKQKYNFSSDMKNENAQTTMANFLSKPNSRRQSKRNDNNRNKNKHDNLHPNENISKHKQPIKKYTESKHIIDLCSSSEGNTDDSITSKHPRLDKISTAKKESFEKNDFNSFLSISDKQIDNTKTKSYKYNIKRYYPHSQKLKYDHSKASNVIVREIQHKQNKSKEPLTFFQPKQQTQHSLQQSEINNKTGNHDTSKTFQPDQLNISAKILLSLQKKKRVTEKSSKPVSHAKKYFSKTKTLSHRDVSSLVAMGFPRNQAMKCLQECGGNLTLTVSMLSGPNV